MKRYYQLLFINAKRFVSLFVCNSERERAISDCTFDLPKLVVDVIAKSDVFIYPELLPKMSFLAPHLIDPNNPNFVTEHEDK